MIIYCNLVILHLFHLLCHHVIHCKNPSSVKWFLLIVEQYIHLRQEHVWILLSLPYIQSTVSHTSNFSVLAANWGMWNFSKKREIKFQFCKWTFFPLSRKYSIEDAWSAHQLFSTSQEVKTQRKKHTKNMTVQGQMRNLHSVIENKAARSWIPEYWYFSEFLSANCWRNVRRLSALVRIHSRNLAWGLVGSNSDELSISFIG